MLFNHIWSVSGANDRADVNSTFLQPFANYNLGSGLSVGVSIEATGNWEADEAWTAPLLFNVSKVTLLGKRPVSFALGAGPHVASPDGGAELAVPPRGNIPLSKVITTMKTAPTLSVVCRVTAALLIVVAATACSRQPEKAAGTTPAATATAAATPAASDAPIPDTASPFDALPESARLLVDRPFTGDFDEMVKRRTIRVGRDVQPHALLHRQGSGARPARTRR